MEESYLTINKFKDRIEISANIQDKQLNEKKVNSSVKQIAKLLKRNNFKKKNIIINTNLDLEKDEKEDNQRFTLISALNACKIKDKNDRLKYVYMAACKYLDNEYLGKNICEFCDDVCVAKRKYVKNGNCPDSLKDGCCHEFKLKNLFSSKDVPRCRYQQNRHCVADCLGCKLFACDAVHKKGIKYTYFNVALVRYFFNLGQKAIIRCSVFKPKDVVLRRLKYINF